MAYPSKAMRAEIHIKGIRRFGEARTNPVSPSIRAPQLGLADLLEFFSARPPNQLEEALVDWTRTLGAVSAFVHIGLKPECLLLMSGTDLCDYFCCYKVSKFRARRNALAFPLTPQQAASLQCFDQTMWQHQKHYPCLSTLAMGDNEAVELGQCAHINLG